MTDLKQRIVHFLPDRLRAYEEANLARGVDQATLLFTQYLILLRMGPSGMGRRSENRSLDASTISNIAYQYGPALVASGLAKMLDEREGGVNRLVSLPDDMLLLAPLSPKDFAHLTPNLREKALHECNRMSMLAQRELWRDMPLLHNPSRAEAMTAQPHHNEERRERDKHKPFPDSYVAEMGRKSLWLIQDLAPNLLAIVQRMASCWRESEQYGWGLKTIQSYRFNCTRKILSEHVWRDCQGQPFDTPPFKLGMPKEIGFGTEDVDVNEADEWHWPPRAYRELMATLGTLQMAHYFVVALSMGARQSETLSLQRDCVTYAADGRPYANGRTFKLVQMLDGQEREWQLPDAAVNAIEQQAKLVSLAEQISNTKYLAPVVSIATSAPKHLWAQISASSGSDTSAPLRDINRYLQRYAKTLGMSVQPGGQNIRSHRFRKTLARLVALALTQAPKILMDVFGHKSIEMTLYYILTDKDLRGEIETIARELRVLRAKEAVERIVESQLEPQSKTAHGGYGGRGAETLGNAVQVHRKRVHRRGEDWNETSVYELAELLTMQGTAWEQVRPGVLCTKFSGEAGPCNKSKGLPEPAKCQSSCNHRIEEAFLREDVEGAIRESVANYERALSEGEQLMAAHWTAQIRAHVVRFSDLKEKWMCNSTVRRLMSEGRTTVIP